MNHKPQQRRGLGRGLGSLIPTAPRPADEQPAGSVAVEPEDRPADGPDEGAALSRVSGPGSADWIGVPLPGDPPGSNGNGAGQGTVGAEAEPLDRVDERPATDEAADSGETRDADEHGAADPIGPAGQEALVDGDRGDSQAEDVSDGPVPEGRFGAPAVERDSAPGAAQVAGEPTQEQPGDGVGADTGTGMPADEDRIELRPVAGAYFAELALGQITPNPRQPREVFDEEAMAELVHSIQEVGLLQPIVVRPADQGVFELIMGERRWRAAQQAGLDVIPAIVRETGDDDLLRDALLENLHRSQLNALEEAAAYQQLLEDFGCTHEELATRIGRSRPQISNTIRLLKLSPAVQRRVAAGVLSAGHARALLAVDDAAVQDRLAGRVVAEGISVRGLEEIVAVGDLGSGAPKVRRSKPTAPGVDDLAARLSDRLETRVRVDLGRRKGRITVEFASLPDLERIIGLIDPGHPTRTRQDGSSV